MKLSEMRLLLGAHGIQLTKSLGQNFLHDPQQLARIVAAGGIGPGDRVLEIGPGLGPLTEGLLAAGASVLAVEKDARLVPLLRERLRNDPGLELVQADALVWLRRAPRGWSGWKVVSNLPYSVASPILVELAQAAEPPDLLVATLQLEVVRRVVAQAASDDYGLLSLLVQLRFESGGWFRIPPGCFFPAPEVESACVKLRRRAGELLEPALHRHFLRVVKLAFSQRRKMMLKLLRSGWGEAELQAAFAALGLDPKIRAERVSLEQFVELAKRLPATRAGYDYERRDI